MFWKYFSDPDALVNALAFKMMDLLSSRALSDRLVLRSRLSMANNDVESSAKFVSYLQNGAVGEDVLAAVAEWARSDAGKMGHLINKDALGA